MDKTSLIGIILAFIALSVGMVLKGVSLTALINPAAILIIVVGTIAAVVIAFPSSEIKKTPKLFGKIFKDNKLPTIQEMIPLFSNWAQIARREGLLALEASIEEVDDDFLKNGLSMAVDGQSAEFIRDVLTEEVDAMSERHQSGALIFTQAGTYALSLI
ncbi:motility-associated protein, partial [Bacillus pumilus]